MFYRNKWQLIAYKIFLASFIGPFDM